MSINKFAATSTIAALSITTVVQAVNAAQYYRWICRNVNSRGVVVFEEVIDQPVKNWNLANQGCRNMIQQRGYSSYQLLQSGYINK